MTWATRGGTLGTGFDVDDEEVFVARGGDQVGLSGEGGDAPLESEGVFRLNMGYVAAAEELLLGVVQQGGVLSLPLVEVGVGGLPSVALVMGFEPSSPFAGVFAGEQRRVTIVVLGAQGLPGV